MNDYAEWRTKALQDHEVCMAVIDQYIARIEELERYASDTDFDRNDAARQLDDGHKRIAELERQVADLCPIGDLVGLPAWQVEKQGYMERVADLERVLRLYPEWTRASSGVLFCQVCDGMHRIGHADNCPRQAVLGE